MKILVLKINLNYKNIAKEIFKNGKYVIFIVDIAILKRGAKCVF